MDFLSEIWVIRFFPTIMHLLYHLLKSSVYLLQFLYFLFSSIDLSLFMSYNYTTLITVAL